MWVFVVLSGFLLIFDKILQKKINKILVGNPTFFCHRLKIRDCLIFESDCYLVL